jgi:DNA-binding CsgD family transcriptional regulator
MHPVTLTAILLQLILLGAQGALYLERPHDSARLWYIGLLLLMILLNTANGLMPNISYTLPVHIQHMTVTGTGFAVASYYPLYFYKAFGLERLRFHATYGVPLFLLLPYLIFFIIAYSINHDIDFARRYGFAVPMLYSFALLFAIARAIYHAHRSKPDRQLIIEEIATYTAMLPWAAMPMVVYYDFGQLSETLFANLGFMAVSTLMLYQSIRFGRAEHRQLDNLRAIAMDTKLIEKNCTREMLSPRETEIAILLCHRLKRREIADKLFISERTVDKHTERIFSKVGVTSREELLTKLNKIHKGILV